MPDLIQKTENCCGKKFSFLLHITELANLGHIWEHISEYVMLWYNILLIYLL